MPGTVKANIGIRRTTEDTPIPNSHNFICLAHPGRNDKMSLVTTTLTQRRTSEPPPGRVLPSQDTNGAGTEQQKTVWKLQGGSIIVSSTPDENRRRLRALMSRVKWATKESETLAEAFNAFEGVVVDCRVLCEAVVDFEVKKRGGSRSASGAAVVAMEGGREVQFSDWVAKVLERSPGLMEVRDWRDTLGRLIARYREALDEEVPEVDVSDLESEASFASSNSVPPNVSINVVMFDVVDNSDKYS